MRGLSSRSEHVGPSGRLAAGWLIIPVDLHYMFQFVLDCMEAYDRTRKEDHEVVLATLNYLHYF